MWKGRMTDSLRSDGKLFARYLKSQDSRLRMLSTLPCENPFQMCTSPPEQVELIAHRWGCLPEVSPEVAGCAVPLLTAASLAA
eukprot:5713359-Amphidinium_carterae.1